MLTIYGNRFSDNCASVEYVANLLELDYEYHVLDFQKGDHKKPEHLKRSPAGKVPAIDDDGFTLFESGAITKYLCEKHNSTLYPADLKQRATINAWIDFSVIHIGGAKNRVVFNKLLAESVGVPVDKESLKAGTEFLERFLPVVDKQLHENKFLAGDTLSLADVMLLAMLTYAEQAEFGLEKYTSLSKWRNALKEMDFYKKVHNKEGVGKFS